MKLSVRIYGTTAEANSCAWEIDLNHLGSQLSKSANSEKSLNPNYVLELRDEPLKYNKTGTYRDEA